jgi:anchored repeat ABC transporter substrate-binding protein
MLAVVMMAAGCGGDVRHSGKLRVATTIGIIGDLARQVGGDRVEVSSIVPAGGDPHSYEPVPSDARKVVDADVILSNGMLLEERSIAKLIRTNASSRATQVGLADQVQRRGGLVIPLHEDLGLDTLWLGLAVVGKTPGDNADIKFTLTKVDGPGHFFVYLTNALGTPEIYFNSADGIDSHDQVTLPPDAHTHVNWAFDKPGTYKVTVAASIDATGGGSYVTASSGTFTFVVGQHPTLGTMLDKGHADVAVNLDTRQFSVRTTASGGQSGADKRAFVPADEAVLSVPDSTKTPIPAEKVFGFLGAAGSPLWVLPQAVLGKHVHGDNDPHMWESVKQAELYVRIITDTLIAADPAGKTLYQANSRRYLAQLAALQTYVVGKVGTIPVQNRQLITTHDAFGYWASEYGMKIAGFVVPNPGQEPSAAQVKKLAATVAALKPAAVFAEPNLVARATVLRQVAKDNNVQVCTIYADAFDQKVTTYLAMIRHNADEMARCLGGK